MQPKFAAFLALAAVAVQAAPEKRDSSSGNGFETITLPNGTPFVIPTGTVDVGVAASFVDANSGVIASVLGTETLLKLEASVALVEAEEAIGAATTVLTAIVTTINSTPVVKVSSIGGKNEITIATGTKAGATTVFGGKAFTAVPNAAQQLASVPRGLWAGAAAVLGSMALGAALIL
ncbi:hypothetical protein GY45DRAFT_1374758 [Cubamyces sp. BRFM 1775]|nr:hypothetical protein GY45DRAFT_1374758 [Cubamyces sp. BRFM 1775]